MLQWGVLCPREDQLNLTLAKQPWAKAARKRDPSGGRHLKQFLTDPCSEHFVVVLQIVDILGYYFKLIIHHNFPSGEKGPGSYIQYKRDMHDHRGLTSSSFCIKSFCRGFCWGMKFESLFFTHYKKQMEKVPGHELTSEKKTRFPVVVIYVHWPSHFGCEDNAIIWL